MDSPIAEDVILGGRYRLGALLGAGGMAEVYDGWDERLARPVAIKLLRPELAANPALGQRFEREARAAARLTHPNVVGVYDAGEDRGRSYIVMERLAGESLADSIARGPLDLVWLRRLATEVLAALGAAHAAGIIHRDIKPANILLGPDGRAKVADFGIASVVESRAASEAAGALTSTGMILGTAAYLAPERAMGHEATPKSDIYSVGVVLYEALTGQKPFEGATPVAVAAAAVQGAAIDPSRIRPGADPELVAVIGRAMAVDPAMRFASAAEMANALRPGTPVATAFLPVPPPLSGARPYPPTAMAGRAPVPRLARRPARPRPPWPPQRGKAMFVALALAAAVVVLALALNNGGHPGAATASSPTTSAGPTTAPTSVPPPASTTPASTSPSTTPAPATDAMGRAIQTIASQLTAADGPAYTQLADGLKQIAALGPEARGAAATALLSRIGQWYQQGQLKLKAYATSTALLTTLAAGGSTPPATKKSGNSNGDEGG